MCTPVSLRYLPSVRVAVHNHLGPSVTPLAPSTSVAEEQPSTPSVTPMPPGTSVANNTHERRSVTGPVLLATSGVLTVSLAALWVCGCLYARFT